jgi:hypothetical protein
VGLRDRLEQREVQQAILKILPRARNRNYNREGLFA